MGDITGALRRRWPLAIVGLLLAVAAAVGAAATTSPTYSFTSTVLLLPPKPTTQVETGGPDFTQGNPLFFLSNLTTTRDLLDSRMMQKNAQRVFADRFPGVGYAAAPDILGSTPTVVLTTTGPTEAAARAAVTYLRDQVPDQLADLQSDLQVEEKALITSRPLFTDDEPTISDKARIRTGIFAGGLVGLVMLMAIGLLDGLLRGRKRAAGGPAPVDEAAAESAAPAQVAETGAQPAARAPGRRPTESVDTPELSDPFTTPELSEAERLKRRARRKQRLAELSDEERQALRERRARRERRQAAEAATAVETSGDVSGDASADEEHADGVLVPSPESRG